MSGLFVGAWVRIVSSSACPELIGQETRINAVAPLHYAAYGYDWLIDICRDGVPLGACNDHLEPILPEGHQPSEYSLSELLDKCRQGEGVSA